MFTVNWRTLDFQITSKLFKKIMMLCFYDATLIPLFSKLCLNAFKDSRKLPALTTVGFTVAKKEKKKKMKAL